MNPVTHPKKIFYSFFFFHSTDITLRLGCISYFVFAYPILGAIEK